MRRIIFYICFLLLLALALFYAIPSSVRSQRSPLNEFMNNLRQIDGCKTAVALERRIGDMSHVFQQSDLAPYMGRGGDWIQPVTGDRDVINSLQQSPAAGLTTTLKLSSDTKYPPGTIFRLNTKAPLEIVLPGR